MICGLLIKSLLSFVDWGMIMNRTLDNNSTLLPLLFVILTGFVERPVVDSLLSVELTLWVCWASQTCAAALNVPGPPNFPLCPLKVWPNWPARQAFVGSARFDKEVAISSFQFENLRERKNEAFVLMFIRWWLPACPCWSTQCSCTPPHMLLEPPWLLQWAWLSGGRGSRWKGWCSSKFGRPSINFDSHHPTLSLTRCRTSSQWLVAGWARIPHLPSS